MQHIFNIILVNILLLTDQILIKFFSRYIKQVTALICFFFNVKFFK